MKCFLVAATEGSEISTEDITSAFPNYYEVVPGRVWIVASEYIATTEGICMSLRIHPPTNPAHKRTALVTGLSDFNGYAQQSLWDQLKLWGAM